jgi:hypothetical protein
MDRMEPLILGLPRSSTTTSNLDGARDDLATTRDVCVCPCLFFPCSKVLSLGRLFLGTFCFGMFCTCDIKSQDVLFRDVLSLGTLVSRLLPWNVLSEYRERPGHLIQTFRSFQIIPDVWHFRIWSTIHDVKDSAAAFYDFFQVRFR